MQGEARKIARVARWLTQAGLEEALRALEPDPGDFYAASLVVCLISYDPVAFVSCRWHEVPARSRRTRPLRDSILALCAKAVIGDVHRLVESSRQPLSQMRDQLRRMANSGRPRERSPLPDRETARGGIQASAHDARCCVGARLSIAELVATGR